jgi:WD40 repeat protein/tRNA A-37 threonylcarbamoyl transferase component Bud32
VDTGATPEPDRGLTTELGEGDTVSIDGSRGAGRARTLEAGEAIARFTVLRKLGEGGMGIVYAAYDDELDRKIAIKVVRAERVDELTRARVLREAQAMAKLSHPNVVQIYDVGVHHEQVYVAMEFVAGPTLAAWTKVWTEQAAAGGRAAWPEILAHYVEAGRGLAAAHAVGLVHRDFKPVNAIVGEDGRVRVLDFGIARPIAPREASLGLVAETRTGPSPALRLVEGEGDTNVSGTGTLTKTGALVGTPAYMSPEQFAGGAVDARSDQFGFCVALWEALHGERPFEGRTPGALLFAMQSGEIRSPPSSGPGAVVPSWLRERIRRGLACEPDERWPSMDALLAALLDDPAHRRRRAAKLVLGVGLALALVSGAFAFAHVQQVEAEATTAAALAEEAEAQRKALAAEAARDLALADARASASRARDTARILAARSLSRDPTLAAALLREVEDIGAAGWRSAALDVLQQPISRQVLDVHDDRIVDVSYSPDGAWLASASFDGRIRLWSTQALRVDRYYELAAGDRLFDLDFDPTGLRIVGASRNATAPVWRLPSEPPSRAAQPLAVEQVLRAPDLVWTARFSPQGDRVVAGTRAGVAVVWTLSSGPAAGELEPSASVPIVPRNVWHAEFSPQGDRVALASSDGRVMLWTPGSEQLVELGRFSQGDAWVANFSPDGRFVASSGLNGEVHVYGVEPLGVSFVLRGHTGSVQRLAWAPDGRHLASASQDHSVRIWPLDASGELAGPPRTLEFGSTQALVPAFSPDSRWLAVGSVEPTVHVVELAGGLPIELRGHTSDVFALRFSPDGRQLVTSSHDRSLRIWDTDWSRVERRFAARLAVGENRWLVPNYVGRTRLWSLADDGVHAGPELDADIDHEWAAVGRVGPALDWLVVGGRDLALHGFALADAADDRLAPRWHIDLPAPPLSIPIDPQGYFVGAVYMDRLRLWHFAQGRLEGQPRAVEHGIDFDLDWALVGFSPDGRLLVTASTRGDVVFAELDGARGEITARHVQPKRPNGGRANGLIFAPTGEYFVMTALDRSVRVWSTSDLHAPQLELSLPSEARSLVLDPERGEVLLGCNDGVIRRLDPRTGTLEPVEGGFDGSPLSMASDAGLLVLGTNQGELRIVDGLADMPSLRLGGGVRRVELSLASQLIAATDDQVLQVLWLGDSLAPERLHARLRAATDRCPSARERIELAGEPPELAARGCE